MALYREILSEFHRFDAQLLEISADFEPKGGVSRQFGVYRAQGGTSERALFVIDPDVLHQRRSP